MTEENGSVVERSESDAALSDTQDGMEVRLHEESVGITVVATRGASVLAEAILDGNKVRKWVPANAVNGGTCNLSVLHAGIQYGDNLEALLTPYEVDEIGSILATELRRRDCWWFADLQDPARLKQVEQAVRVTLALALGALRRRAKQLGG